MIPKLTLVALGLAGLASANFAGLASGSVFRSAAPLSRCGTPEPSREHMQRVALLRGKKGGEGKGFKEDTVTVDTYVHVVSPSEQEDTSVTETAIQEQLDVLNADFSNSSFSFNLVDTTRTVNEKWALESEDTTIGLEMKRALRKGSYSDLNIYLVSSLGGRILGECNFPVPSPDADTVSHDGCSVLASTIPGGSTKNYDLGKTATHEVGHWMGLLHTFTGGCYGDGDGMSDTPAQRGPTDGCPAEADTCPNDEGLDPIHNYMDYSDDLCLTEFTPMQTEAMHRNWKEYRGAPAEEAADEP